MKEAIQEYATVGLVHFMLWKDHIRGEGDFNTVSNILDDPFFGGIEVSWVNDPAQRSLIADLASKAGKRLTFGAQPVLLTQKLDVNSLDEAERIKAVTALKGAIPHAVDMNAKGFALLSGKTVDAANKSRAMEQLVKSLVDLGAELKPHGIPLVLETFDQLDYGKNALIGPHADAAEIAREVKKSVPNFGLMIDLSHLPLMGETAQQVWDAAGQYVVHAHIGNAVMEKPDHSMNGDEHPPLCDPAGENCVDEVTEYLKVLHQGGFLSKEKKPMLSFEVCIYGDYTRENVLADSKRILKEAWERV